MASLKPMAVDLPGVVGEVVAEINDLLATAAFLEEVVDRPNLIEEWFRIDCEVDATPGAAKVRISAEPSDRLLLLLAALRAGNAHLRTIRVEHGPSPSVVGGEGTASRTATRAGRS